VKKLLGPFALALLLCSTAFVPGSVADNLPNITICHIPPGNPANAHEITVDISAIPAHLAHGDNFGACNCDGPDCPVAPPCDGPDCPTNSIR
jgi:hypothetical protein